MPDYKYSDLSVQVVDQAESNQYAVGVEIGGAFITFAILKKNAVESDIAEAQEAAAEAERQRAAQPQQPQTITTQTASGNTVEVNPIQ